jgi:sugar diacid utilization regulator/GAF domain-containing protein
VTVDTDQGLPIGEGVAAALQAVAALRRAASVSPQAVITRTAEVLASLVGAEAALISPSDDSWRIVGASPSGGVIRSALEALPPEARDWSTVHVLEAEGLSMIPLRPGSLALVVDVALDPSSASAAELQLAARGCELLVADAERIAEMQELVTELSALEAVAIEILSVRQADQVLLSIARQTLALLEADMAGVFLREGERLVMRSCVGHRRADTARLCIEPGHGLAGRVLETAEPCKVDSYLESDIISHEFNPLALAEDTQSAVGAPLIVHGEVIGVLEVWRRHRSVFSDRHVRRIVALANLAAIAIDNARLYDRQQESVRRLAAAEASLSVQLSAMTDLHALQRALIGHVLDGGGLGAIVQTVAETVGGEVAVFSSDGDPVTSFPLAAAKVMHGEVQRRIRTGATTADSTSMVLRDGRWLTLQEIRAGRDRLGWFCLMAAQEPGSGMAVAVGEAALCCALCQLEQRAADQALSDAREQLVWDLLDASPDHRLAAASRAARLHIDVARPHRVLRATVENLEDLARAAEWDTLRLDRIRREVLGTVRRVIADHRAGELVAARGDSLTAIVSCTDSAAVRDLIGAVRSEMSRLVPGLVSTWGASATRDDPLDLQAAHREAAVSLHAAQRLGADGVAIHDELGVVRLLLASGSDPKLGAFVDDVIGPVVDHDRLHDGDLIKTLRAYFAADCSQQDAAKQLFVHHKTLRYRLDRIEALTSLDLRRHDDRVRADLALKIFDVARLGTTSDDP